MAEEKEIEALENLFPHLADAAFAEARERVLASGQSILQAHNGVIYRVFPDGSKRFVKRIDPPFRVVRRRFKL